MEKDDGLADILAEAEPGAIVTKWVMVAEVMEADGRRGVARTWSESCAPWDVAGLLAWASDDSLWDEESDDDPD